MKKIIPIIRSKVSTGIRKATSNTILGKITNDFTVKRLMHHFNVDEYGHQASIKNADLGYGWVHYGIIRNLKPKRILCVGSRHGYIPAILAQACRDNNKGFVDFVDASYGEEDENHWTGVAYWKTKKGKNCFNKFGLKKWIETYVQTTQEFADKHKDKYDYIYIDGDHSYKGVKLDYDLFWPRLNINGFMTFHDINVTKTQEEGVYGVQKLWRQKSKKNAIQFFFEGSGLGIIQKRK